MITLLFPWCLGKEKTIGCFHMSCWNNFFSSFNYIASLGFGLLYNEKVGGRVDYWFGNQFYKRFLSSFSYRGVFFMEFLMIEKWWISSQFETSWLGKKIKGGKIQNFRSLYKINFPMKQSLTVKKLLLVADIDFCLVSLLHLLPAKLIMKHRFGEWSFGESQV